MMQEERNNDLHGGSSRSIRFDLQHILWCILIVLPAISLILLSVLSGNDCFSGRPVWSDETDYWREVYSFSQVQGFSFGRYGLYIESPAAIGPLGCHGILPILLYGPYSLLFGWGANSIVLCNCGICCICFLAFVLILRPSIQKCIAVAILWLCYLPILLYIPTSMIELPLYGLVLLSVALSVRALTESSNRPGFLIAAFVVVSVIVTIRISYAVLYIPLMLIGSGFRFNKTLLLYALISSVLTVSIMLVSGLFTAPYPLGFISRLGGQAGLQAKADLIADHSASNFAHLFSYDDGAVQSGQRFLYMMTAVALLAVGVKGWFYQAHKRVEASPKVLIAGKVAIVGFLILAFELVAVVELYDIFDWRDYRVLAPVLWGVLMLIVLTSPKWEWMSLLGIAVVLSSAGLITLGNVGAFNEAARYQPLDGEVPEWINMVTATGESVEDKTLVLLDSDGSLSTPEALPFELEPDIGYVYCLNSNYLETGYHAKWAYSKKAVDLKDYYVVASSDQGILYEYCAQ